MHRSNRVCATTLVSLYRARTPRTVTSPLPMPALGAVQQQQWHVKLRGKGYRDHGREQWPGRKPPCYRSCRDRNGAISSTSRQSRESRSSRRRHGLKRHTICDARDQGRSAHRTEGRQHTLNDDLTRGGSHGAPGKQAPRKPHARICAKFTIAIWPTR
jgi:hypothetical protein